MMGRVRTVARIVLFAVFHWCCEAEAPCLTIMKCWAARRPLCFKKYIYMYTIKLYLENTYAVIQIFSD